MEEIEKKLAQANAALAEWNQKFNEEQRQRKVAEAALEAEVRGLRNENELHSDALRKARPREIERGQENTARVRELEAEIMELKEQQKRKAVEGGKESPKRNRAGDENEAKKRGGDIVTMTRAEKEAAEKKYGGVKQQLLQKKKECEDLKQRLSRVTGGSEPSDEQITAQWCALREKIRALTLEQFNETMPVKNVSDAERKHFESLTPHWKTFFTTKAMRCYLFRAVLWRFLYQFIFDRPGIIWEQEIHTSLTGLEDTVNKKGEVDFDDYMEWRAHTYRLLDTSLPRDEQYIKDISAKAFAELTKFANGADVQDLKEAIKDIVESAGGLTVAFMTGRTVPLMSDRPWSDLRSGFAYNEETMDIRSRCGKEGVVDLIFSPCLLKRVAKDFKVLVKAEVVC